jgi:hypothetical protein
MTTFRTYGRVFSRALVNHLKASVDAVRSDQGLESGQVSERDAPTEKHQFSFRRSVCQISVFEDN